MSNPANPQRAVRLRKHGSVQRVLICQVCGRMGGTLRRIDDTFEHVSCPLRKAPVAVAG